MDGMLLLAACACSSLPTTHAEHATGFVEMECQLHTLALRFADRQQPSMGVAPRQAAPGHDAAPECGSRDPARVSSS